MDRLNKSTSANCADKRKKQSSRFSWVCFFILLHCAFVAKAADEWNFEASGTFDVSSNKTFTDPVNVGNNTLTLNVINSVVFLRNYQTITTSMFQIDGGKLVINGADGKVVTFNGNFDIDYVYTNGLPDSYVGPRSGAAIFMTGSSTVELHYVDFTNFLCNRRNGGNDSGVINFFNSDNNNNGSATFDHINFYKCYAGIPRPKEPSGDNDSKWGRIINIQSGTWNITMTNSSIRHCYINEPYSSNTRINGMGGAIRSQGNVGGTLRLTDCAFEDNLYYDRYTGKLAGQGGVINWRSGNNTGGNPAHLIIKDCRFVRNKAKQGGAIATNAKITIERNTTDATKYTYISKNEAVEGGGIYFWTYNGGQASYDGQGFNADFGASNYENDFNFVRICDNYASECGGGVYIAIDPSNDVGFAANNDTVTAYFNVRFYKGCRIFNNMSPLGAGVSIIDNAGNRHYNGSSATPASKWSGVYVRNISFDGSQVDENFTLKKYVENPPTPSDVAGGGVYIIKQQSPNAGFNTDFTDASYGSGGLTTVSMIRGIINSNKAIQGTFQYGNVNQDEYSPFTNIVYGTQTGYGGGYYIASKFTNASVVSTLNVNIGTAGKTLEMYNNEAYTDGGGVYVLYDREDGHQNEGTVTVEGGTIGKINTTDPQNPVLCPNEALTGNGGGICVMGGTVVVKGGKIEYNTADTGGGGLYVSVPNKESITTIQGTASISYNTANNGNGGGVCLDKGRINIYGSNISYNKATKGNGGGLYIQEGDIFVWPNEVLVHPNAPVISECEKTKTMVLNNTAGGNGGGLNTHRGRFDVRFAEINNNTAGYNYSSVGTNGGNGGGLFCDGTDHDNGYTVRLLHCDLEENKAFGNVYEGEGITGRGGGVYLKHGSIFAEHCDIIKNEADINGGGLDNHSGELRVYGSYIDENVAHEGRGGGLYTEEGNIVVGPCDTYGYKDSKASRIIKNKAKINGGGINNHRGDITIHGDRINENEAETGHGGGVYIKEGNIFMYGGQINNNKADKGKGGGVYGGGGKFNIMERKANPIVEIIEVEDIKATEFNVHYHLVDRGLVPVTVSGEDPNYTYSDPGNLTHGIAYIKNGEAWADSSYVEYNSTSHLYVLRQGCVRIPLTSLSASQLYQVKAYAKYSLNGVNYFDASPVMQIATTGANPVVATGEASEIGENSAKVTGKLFYKGDNDAGVVTKGIRYSKDGEDSWTNVDSYGSEDEFSVTLTGLAPGTTYQAQAYATNGENTGYGDVTITFTTATGGKAPQGPRSVYPAVEENPFFMELTPLQQAILASTPMGDSTTAAPAIPAKTHRDDPQAQPPVDIPEINKNSAKYGGGICIDLAGAKLVFAGSREANAELGQINKNYASEAGGGIYIGYQTEGDTIGPAMMQMMGKCEVNKNRVPAGKLGGGIYLDGRFYVGDQDTDAIGTHGLKVDKNFAIDKDQATFETELDAVIADTASPEVVAQYGKKTMNNVFLPRNEYNYYEHDDDASTETYNKVSVITLLSDISGYADQENKTDPYSHIGFSVVNGFCPVIATSNRFGGDYVVHNYERTPDSTETWLYHLMGMSITDNISGNDSTTVDALRGAIFEDSESYVAVHTRHDQAPFRNKYIYLWGCWTHPVVMDDPESLQPMVGATNADNPSADPKWLGHYVIRNHEQNTDTDTGDPLEWEIYSAEGLAWFTSYVNGLNAFDQKEGGDTIHWKWRAARNPKAKAKIMNDLDMSAFLWVPIGSVQKFYLTALTSNDGSSLFVDSETQVMKINPADPTSLINDDDYSINKHYYQGTFDGQGHIIKGLQGLYLTGIRKFGLFGYLADGAVVMNTFVDEGLFVSDDDNITYHAGGIAGTMQGTAPSISNSEARMTLNATFSADNSAVGGLVGEVKTGSIHSCMAMPTFIGTTQNMGGVTGKLAAGTSIRNCFTNVLFPSTLDYKVGGIVGNNSGIVENVYVRYNYENNTPNLANDKFYWIAGLNTGSISYCFSPKDNTGSGKWVYTEPGSTAATKRRTYQPTNLVSDKYGFAHDDQKAEAFDNNSDGTDFIPMENGNPLSRMTYDETTHETYFNGLVGALNNWVEDVNKTSAVKYTPWMRTMASTINDDYPVLMFNDFNVVGTENGIYMKYDDNVNDMWKEPNPKSLDIAEKTGKNFQNLTAALNPKAAMYLYKTNGVTAKNSTPVAINVTKNAVVPLHIHQNIGITQATVNDSLTARVGVTFDNTDCSIDLGGEKYDWHMFSSALKAAPLGITYQSGVTEDELGGKDYEIYNNIETLSRDGIADTDYKDRNYMDPPVIIWNTEEGTVGYFPTNTPYGKWGNSGHWPSSGAFSNPTVEQPYSFDFYCFHEPSRHWINFKREGTPEFMDHWHQDIDGSGKHQNLWYKNESTLQVGKGYMMGVSAVSMLMADGILNNGDVTSQEPLTNSEYSFNMSGYSEDLRGINLVGNPYQSYLDFTELAQATENAGIIYSETYYLFDADAKRYISYTADASDNKPYYAPRYIHPHQGFFIKTANNESQLTFTNAMRKETGDPSSYFRGQDLNYPLVNLFCYDGDGHYDLTTVEMNRPQLGGGEKLKDMRFGNSLLYASMDDADYQTLFAPEGTSTVAVRFKASQNGVYTLRWETMHGDFQHLHLIDNLAGVDVDCMRQSEYRFEASTTDYLSRFKLVFDVTDVEENADEAESATFAFQMGDELVVNGSGELSVFDIQGRCIASQRLAGTQSSISLPRAASGMYILRLTGDKQVKTQKLIIK